MTNGMKNAHEKIVRMDDLVMDDLFSLSDEQLLQEASEEGIDVVAIGAEGRKAFERAQVVVGRNRLAIVREEMARDAVRQPAIYDRVNARSKLDSILTRNKEAANKLTMAARNETQGQSADFDGLLDDFVELGAIAEADEDKDS
jgi:hypothetical protein